MLGFGWVVVNCAISVDCFVTWWFDCFTCFVAPYGLVYFEVCGLRLVWLGGVNACYYVNSVVLLLHLCLNLKYLL